MSQSSGPTTTIQQQQQSLDTNHQSIYYQSLTPPPHQQPGFYSTLSSNQPQEEISHQNNMRMQTDLKLQPASPSVAAGASSCIDQSTQQQLQANQSCIQQQPAVPECSGCLCQIQDRYYLFVMDRVWHLSCLRCYDCKQSLDTQQSCFSKDGVIYCKADYFKQFPRKCQGCCQDITPNELIMRARNSVYHMHCFKCLVCERQLNTGDEFGIGKDNISILCRAHYTYQPDHLQQQHQHQQQPMYGTNFNEQSLQGQFNPQSNYNNNYPVEYGSHQMTNDLSLQSSQQQPGYGNIYMCNLPPTPGISPPNSQHFHSHPQQHQQQQTTALNHINDSNQSPSGNQTKDNSANQVKGRPKKRKAPANSNNESGQSNKKLVKSNSSKASTASSGNNKNLVGQNSEVSNTNASNGTGISNNNANSAVSTSPIQNSTSLNTSGLLGSVDSPDEYIGKHFDNNLDYFSDEDEDDLLDTSSNGANEGVTGSTGCHSLLNSTSSGYYDSVAAVAAAAAAAQRQKRMRTSFKHHQLRVMKSYFELNHNPDAKDLKQLSQKTGLSKRVLQVWFQNARAKFRRGQGGPECPASAHSPSPNVSLNIGPGNLNSNGQGAASTSSLSSNSSSLSSSSSISSASSDSQLQMLKQQQHHQHMIDDPSAYQTNYTNLNSVNSANPNTNGAGNISQSHMSQMSVGMTYSQHMMSAQQQQQQSGGPGANDFMGDNIIIS